ncbi:hypothetical protein OnM2_034030, partial [Erysiphe neolycopersici]
MTTKSKSRPPLTTRLRATFDSRRTKNENPVANQTVALDTDSLRLIFEESLNAQPFQSAIASSLAKLIQPNIKDALDTLQPVVEAVCAHEVLLRKANSSVENLIARLETDHLRYDSKSLSGLDVEGPIRKNVEYKDTNSESPIKHLNLGPSHKEIKSHDNLTSLTEISERLEAQNSKINMLSQDIKPIKDFVMGFRSDTQQSDAATAEFKTQLDQIGHLVSVIHSNIGEKMDNIKNEIECLKSKVEQTSSGDERLDKVIAATNQIDENISDLKEKNRDSELLKSTQTNNVMILDQVINTIETKLNKLPAMLDRIESHLTQVDATRDTESILLKQIISKFSTEQNHIEKFEGLLASQTSELGSVIEKNVSQLELLSDIKSLQLNQKDVLSKLQSLNTIYIKENKSQQSRLTSINDQFSSLSLALSTITIQLEEFKNKIELKEAAQISSLSKENAETKISFQAIIDGIQAQTQLFNEIRENLSAEILSTLHSLGQKNEVQHNLLTDIKEADVSAEILTSLHDLVQKNSDQQNLLTITRGAERSEDILNALSGIREINEGQSNILSLFRKEDEDRSAKVLEKLNHLEQRDEIHGNLLTGIKEADASEEILATLNNLGKKNEENHNILTEIKESDVSAEILTTLHDLDQKNEAQHNLLTEIKENKVGVEILTTLHDLGQKNEENHNILTEIK